MFEGVALQIVDVRDAHLGREAWIDGAATGAFAVHLRRRVIGVHDVRVGDPEAFEVGAEERRVRVHVQHARHADADLGPALHTLDTGARRCGPRTGRNQQHVHNPRPDRFDDHLRAFALEEREHPEIAVAFRRLRPEFARDLDVGFTRRRSTSISESRSRTSCSVSRVCGPRK